MAARGSHRSRPDGADRERRTKKQVSEPPPERGHRENNGEAHGTDDDTTHTQPPHGGKHRATTTERGARAVAAGVAIKRLRVSPPVSVFLQPLTGRYPMKEKVVADVAVCDDGEGTKAVRAGCACTCVVWEVDEKTDGKTESSKIAGTPEPCE